MSCWRKVISVIRYQIVKQVAETRGRNVRSFKLSRYLPVTLVADFLIGQFVVCPLVTMCWRSVWMTGDWLIDRLETFYLFLCVRRFPV